MLLIFGYSDNIALISLISEVGDRWYHSRM